jgi:hypothetical protein
MRQDISKENYPATYTCHTCHGRQLATVIFDFSTNIMEANIVNIIHLKLLPMGILLLVAGRWLRWRRWRCRKFQSTSIGHRTHYFRNCSGYRHKRRQFEHSGQRDS